MESERENHSNNPLHHGSIGFGIAIQRGRGEPAEDII
jgi:pantoate kinase